MTEPKKPSVLARLTAFLSELIADEGPQAEAAVAAAEPTKEPEPAAVTLQSVKLADATVVELSAPPVAVLVSLEAVAMADGGTFNYNPITRRLTDGAGKMVESGVYKCADGSYFQVDTSQYTYTIDATTYERATQLSAVETQLATAQADLAAERAEVIRLKEETPAAKPLKMAAQTGGSREATPEKPWRVLFAKAD